MTDSKMIPKEKLPELCSEEVQEIMGAIPSRIVRWGIMVLFGIVAVLIIGSAFFSYPDVIHAPIKLTGAIPPAGVVALSSGKLDMLNTVDNQYVKTGDYLAVIHNTAQTEDVMYLKQFLNDLDMERDSTFEMPEKNLQLGNFQPLYASFYVVLFNCNEYMRQQYYPNKIRMAKDRLVQYADQYNSLLRQQKITKEQSALIDKTFERSVTMHEHCGISGKELDETRSRQLQGQLSEESMLTSINNMQIQMAQLNESIIDMAYQHTEKMNDFHSQLRSMISQLKASIQSWEMNYVLTSPVDGKITFTRYWVSNQNVQAGEEVFTVLPVLESPIIGKAMLPVARSGKVKTGQKVIIRLDNFPDNEFGMLQGVVRNISLVPATSGGATYYVVEIDLPEGFNTNYKKELPQLPDMQGTADIVMEEMSLLERFVLPINKIKSLH